MEILTVFQSLIWDYKAYHRTWYPLSLSMEESFCSLPTSSEIGVSKPKPLTILPQLQLEDWLCDSRDTETWGVFKEGTSPYPVKTMERRDFLPPSVKGKKGQRRGSASRKLFEGQSWRVVSNLVWLE
jgi:hypothetical protein